MATPNLTCSGTPRHYNAVTHGGSTHFAVVKMARWNNKELVVTPTESKFVFAYAYAPAASFPTVRTYLDSRSNKMNSTMWSNGAKALCSYYTSFYSPRALKAGTANSENYAEVGGSIIALKFNLRNLPIDKTDQSTSKFYIRAWCPSIVLVTNDHNSHEGIGPRSNVWPANANFSTVEYRFFDSLQSYPRGIGGDDTNRFDLYGNNGLGIGVSCSTCKNYDPFNSRSQNLNLRVYANDLASPSMFYRDYEIASNSTAWKYLRAGGHGNVWLCAQYRQLVPFAQFFTNNANIRQSLTCYIQRLELVMKLSIPAGFNL